MPHTTKTALVLGGGNALGAYLAGAYEHLHRQDIRPDWIVGASVGAVTGAILAGNVPEKRLEKLGQFWDEATQHTYGALSGNETLRQTYNGMHSVMTLLFCRPNIFQRRYPGLWSILPWVPNDVAIYDHAPLRRTLERLVDFERLNRADVRLTVGCVDLESGDEVYFDNTREEIRPEHILASTAITPAFPPVEIGGRLLCDPGYANNLPLDPIFDEPLEQDLLCIAVELFSLRSPQPASLDAVLERTQDILFASAARRSIKALQRSTACAGSLIRRGRTSGCFTSPTKRPATSSRRKRSTSRRLRSRIVGPWVSGIWLSVWACFRASRARLTASSTGRLIPKRQQRSAHLRIPRAHWSALRNLGSRGRSVCRDGRCGGLPARARDADRGRATARAFAN